MDKYLPIENNNQYVRDIQTGAVVLQDSAELDKYKLERKRRVDEKLKMHCLENEIAEMKKAIYELSGLINTIKKE